MTVHCTYSCDSCGAVFDKTGILHEYPLRITDPDTPHQGHRMHICRLCAANETARILKAVLTVMPSLCDREMFELWTAAVNIERKFVPKDDDEEAVE